MTLFLMGDAAVCAKRGQKVPAGYYNLEVMIKSVLHGAVVLRGTCMDVRGLTHEEMVEAARRSTMSEPTDITLDAQRALVF